MKKINFIVLFSVVFFASLSSANTEQTINNFASRQEVQNFITNMKDKHNFDRDQLETLFKQYDTNKYVLEKISNPSEKLS